MSIDERDVPYWQPGMTLRDYMAAAAMPVIMDTRDLSKEDIARHAYAMADAMLAEREKTRGQHND